MDLTRHELVERARSLVPALRKRAAQAEQERQLPAATHRELLDAGLYRIYLPRRYGGYELDFQLQVDVAAQLGRGCGSTAWVWSILASHNWVHGMLDPKAQDEVWEADPDALIATGFPSRDATVTPTGGDTGAGSSAGDGYLVDGTWSFASGIDQSEWVHLNMFVPAAGDEPAHHRFGLVAAADTEVVDDWYATGMRGTGSKSLRLREVFIPAYRTLATQECVGAATPGHRQNPAPLYRLPLFAMFTHAIAGPAVGIARGALELLLDRFHGGESRPTVQVRLAEASAEIDAAHALLAVASDQATAAATAGVVPPLADRVRWRRDGAYAATLCLRAVQRLHPLAGARGLDERDPYQRALRDVHAVCAHIALTWDVQAANYGGVLLGLPSSDPKL